MYQEMELATPNIENQQEHRFLENSRQVALIRNSAKLILLQFYRRTEIISSFSVFFTWIVEVQVYRNSILFYSRSCILN